MKLSRLRTGVAAAAAALSALAIVASPASASFHLNMVNEVGLQSGSGDNTVQFVEFFDKGGVEETFPGFEGPYKLVVYDAAGNKLGEQTLSATGLANAASAGHQYLISTHAADMAFGVTGDEALSTSLPLTGGQACYTAGSGETAYSCITWGCIAHPISAVGTGSHAGAVPPAGESDQLQADNSIELAPPTPKAPNIAGANARACATSPGPGGGAGFHGVTVKGHKFKLRHNHVPIVLVCPAPSAGCGGHIKLRLKSGATLGSASFTIGDGKTTDVTVKLKAAKLKRFVGKKKIHAEAVIAAHDDAGHTKTTTAHVVLVQTKSG